MKTKKLQVTNAKSQTKKYAYFKRPEFIAAILLIVWAFGVSAYSFSGPPAGCTPGSCNNPLTVDFENQTVAVANAPTASGQVATKAYVDSAIGASGSDGFYLLDEDNDKIGAYYNTSGTEVKNLTFPSMYKEHDCDDTDTNVTYANTGVCDGDGDGYLNSISTASNTSGFDIDDTTASVATAATVIYQSTAPHNGNLGGRAGIDSLCSGIKPASLSCSEIRGFISVNSSDEIQDMVDNYHYVSANPIYSYYSDGSKRFGKIADNWTDLLDGSIDNALQTIGLPIQGYPWWSGSTSGGANSGHICSGWTTDASNDYGANGTSSTTWSSWINNGSSNLCNNNSVYYLCACKAE